MLNHCLHTRKDATPCLTWLSLFVSFLLSACGSNGKLDNTYDRSALECGEAISEPYLRFTKKDGTDYYQGKELSAYTWAPFMKEIQEIAPTERGCIRSSQLAGSSLLLVRSQDNQARVLTTSEPWETKAVELKPVPTIRPEKSCGARYITSDRIDPRSYLSNEGMDLHWLPFYSLQGRIMRDDSSPAQIVKEFPERLLLSDDLWSLEQVEAGNYKFQLMVKDYVNGGEMREIACDIETTPIALKVRAADQIKTFKTFYDREYGVVEPGYTVNFYIEGTVKNVEIEYCVQEINPRQAESESKSCPANLLRSWLKDDMVQLNEPGFYEIQHRSYKDELKTDWIKTGIMIDKRCSGNFESMEQIIEQGCTELLGNLTLQSVRGGDILDLDILSELSGEIQVIQSYYRTIKAPNLNRIAKVVIRNNQDLENIEAPQLSQVATNIEINGNPKLLTLDGLSNLSFIGGVFQITDNAGIEIIDGFNRLGSLMSFNIARNISLIEIRGFNKLRTADYGIFISDNPQLKSIAGLESVVKTNGSVDLSRLPSLAKIDGLQNIEHIGNTMTLDSLNIQGPELGFSKLQSVGNNLVIRNIGGLETLESLSSLGTIGGLLGIYKNPDLIEVSLPATMELSDRIEIQQNLVLRSASSLGAIQQLYGPIRIMDNPLLTDLSGFQPLTSILMGDLVIQKNPSLKGELGFENLQSIQGTLQISDNEGLESLVGFPSLKKMEALILTDNPKLISLTGLANVHQLMDIRIARNLSLSDLDGIHAPEYMEGQIEISDNENIVSLSALKTLRKLEGALLISGNPALMDLSALDQVESLGALDIRNNKALLELQVFTALKAISGHLMITGNTNLRGVSGFQTLTEIGGIFYLGAHPALESISGFGNLHGVLGRYFHVDSNPGLLKIEGFQSLRSVTGDFRLTQNPSLEDISGFAQLREIGRNLVIDSTTIKTCPPVLDIHSSLQDFCRTQEP